MIYKPLEYSRTRYNIKDDISDSSNQKDDILQLLLEEYKILLGVIRRYPVVLAEFKAEKERISQK